MSLLVIYEILGMFVNTMTADNKSSLHIVRTHGNQCKCNDLRRKTYSNLFVSFLKSASNFEHFERKIDPHS